MTKVIQNIWAGYLDLFGQRPVRPHYLDSTPGYAQDGQALREDWQRVEAYLDHAAVAAFKSDERRPQSPVDE